MPLQGQEFRTHQSPSPTASKSCDCQASRRAQVRFDRNNVSDDLLFKVQLGLPGGSNPPATAEDTGSIPDREDPSKHGATKLCSTAAAPEPVLLDRRRRSEKLGHRNFSDPTHRHHKESSAATETQHSHKYIQSSLKNAFSKYTDVTLLQAYRSTDKGA